MQIYIYIYIYIYVYVNIYIYIYTYIFASIFREWKIFHQSILLPRNGKNLNNFQYFQMKKKSNRETGKYICLYKVEKME